MDLKEILLNAFSGCFVTESSTTPKVDIAVDNLEPNTTLICHGGLLDGHAELRNLAQSASATGHQIVVSGEARDLGFPAWFIGHPFTTEMVVQTITGATQGQPI